jgi:hypothetical protein
MTEDGHFFHKKSMVLGALIFDSQTSDNLGATLGPH